MMQTARDFCGPTPPQQVRVWFIEPDSDERWLKNPPQPRWGIGPIHVPRSVMETHWDRWLLVLLHHIRAEASFKCGRVFTMVEMMESLDVGYDSRPWELVLANKDTLKLIDRFA